MIKDRFIDIYQFIKNPSEAKIEKLTLKKEIKIYLSILIVKFLLSVFILVAIELIFDAKAYRKPHSSILNSFPIRLLLIGIIIPIFEEFAFRLYLKFKPIHIFISSFLIFYFLLTTFYFKVSYIDVTENSFLLRLGISAFVAILLFMTSKKLMVVFNAFWSNQFKLIFYSSALFFGLLHVTNFSIPFEEFYLAPLLVLTHIVSGLIFGYTRIKYGMVLAIVVHISNNLVGVILGS